MERSISKLFHNTAQRWPLSDAPFKEEDYSSGLTRVEQAPSCTGYRQPRLTIVVGWVGHSTAWVTAGCLQFLELMQKGW